MKRSRVLWSTASVLAISSLIALTITSAVAASNAPGSVCKKVGLKAKSGSSSVTCTKVGNKLIWKKSATPKPATSPAKSPTPVASKSPSQSPTPTPSKSASPSPSSKPSTTPTQTNVSAQDSYTITVHASSWFYSFAYSIDGVKNAFGSDSTHSRILVIPAGKPVKLNLDNSADVVHGFWIPDLNVLKEIIPGEITPVSINTDKLGTLKASCSVECGRGHSDMNFTLQVISEADYLKYLASLT